MFIVLPLRYKSLNFLVGEPISKALSNSGRICPVAASLASITVVTYAESAADKMNALSYFVSVILNTYALSMKPFT